MATTLASPATESNARLTADALAILQASGNVNSGRDVLSMLMMDDDNKSATSTEGFGLFEGDGLGTPVAGPEEDQVVYNSFGEEATVKDVEFMFSRVTSRNNAERATGASIRRYFNNNGWASFEFPEPWDDREYNLEAFQNMGKSPDPGERQVFRELISRFEYDYHGEEKDSPPDWQPLANDLKKATKKIAMADESVCMELLTQLSGLIQLDQEQLHKYMVKVGGVFVKIINNSQSNDLKMTAILSTGKVISKFPGAQLHSNHLRMLRSMYGFLGSRVPEYMTTMARQWVRCLFRCLQESQKSFFVKEFIAALKTGQSAHSSLTEDDYKRLVSDVYVMYAKQRQQIDMDVDRLKAEIALAKLFVTSHVPQVRSNGLIGVAVMERPVSNCRDQDLRRSFDRILSSMDQPTIKRLMKLRRDFQQKGKKSRRARAAPASTPTNKLAPTLDVPDKQTKKALIKDARKRHRSGKSGRGMLKPHPNAAKKSLSRGKSVQGFNQTWDTVRNPFGLPLTPEDDKYAFNIIDRTELGRFDQPAFMKALQLTLLVKSDNNLKDADRIHRWWAALPKGSGDKMVSFDDFMALKNDYENLPNGLKIWMTRLYTYNHLTIGRQQGEKNLDKNLDKLRKTGGNWIQRIGIMHSVCRILTDSRLTKEQFQLMFRSAAKPLSTQLQDRRGVVAREACIVLAKIMMVQRSSVLKYAPRLLKSLYQNVRVRVAVIRESADQACRVLVKYVPDNRKLLIFNTLVEVTREAHDDSRLNSWGYILEIIKRLIQTQRNRDGQFWTSIVGSAVDQGLRDRNDDVRDRVVQILAYSIVAAGPAGGRLNSLASGLDGHFHERYMTYKQEADDFRQYFIDHPDERDADRASVVSDVVSDIQSDVDSVGQQNDETDGAAPIERVEITSENDLQALYATVTDNQQEMNLEQFDLAMKKCGYKNWRKQSPELFQQFAESGAGLMGVLDFKLAYEIMSAVSSTGMSELCEEKYQGILPLEPSSTAFEYLDDLGAETIHAAGTFSRAILAFKESGSEEDMKRCVDKFWFYTNSAQGLNQTICMLYWARLVQLLKDPQLPIIEGFDQVIAAISESKNILTWRIAYRAGRAISCHIVDESLVFLNILKRNIESGKITLLAVQACFDYMGRIISHTYDATQNTTLIQVMWQQVKDAVLNIGIVDATQRIRTYSMGIVVRLVDILGESFVESISAAWDKKTFNEYKNEFDNRLYESEIQYSSTAMIHGGGQQIRSNAGIVTQLWSEESSEKLQQRYVLYNQLHELENALGNVEAVKEIDERLNILSFHLEQFHKDDVFSDAGSVSSRDDLDEEVAELDRRAQES